MTSTVDVHLVSIDVPATVESSEALRRVQNSAAEIKIRAERKAGEILSNMDGAGKGGDRKSSTSVVLDLAGIGITKMQSSRWQFIATIPQDVHFVGVAFELAVDDDDSGGGTYPFAMRLAAIGANTFEFHPIK